MRHIECQRRLTPAQAQVHFPNGVPVEEQVRALQQQIIQRKRIATRHRANGYNGAAAKEERNLAIYEAILALVQPKE